MSLSDEEAPGDATMLALEGEDFSEKLIELVRERPYLWDQRDKRYRDSVAFCDFATNNTLISWA